MSPSFSCYGFCLFTVVNLFCFSSQIKKLERPPKTEEKLFRKKSSGFNQMTTSQVRKKASGHCLLFFILCSVYFDHYLYCALYILQFFGGILLS